MRFKIIGKGGVALEKKLRRSNHWSGKKSVGDPIASSAGKSREEAAGASREGVCYTLWCEQCGDQVAAYKGETGRNAFTRGEEHLEALEARNAEKSVLWLHSVHHQQGRKGVPYSMKVTTTHTTPMDRQVRERVDLSNFKGPVPMNTRNKS